MATLIPNHPDEENSTDAFVTALQSEDDNLEEEGGSGIGMMDYEDHEEDNESANGDDSLEDPVWTFYQTPFATRSDNQSTSSSGPPPDQTSSRAAALHGIVVPYRGGAHVVSDDEATDDEGKEQEDSDRRPALVEIIGGVHEGKVAILVKRTAKKVAVQLVLPYGGGGDGTGANELSSTRYLDPNNVRPLGPGGGRPSDASLQQRGVAAVDPSHRVGQDRSRSSPDAPSDRAGPNDALVEIVGGVHKGKRAIFVSRTEKRVAVRLLEDGPESKPRHLLPANVRFPREAATAANSPRLVGAVAAAGRDEAAFVVHEPRAAASAPQPSRSARDSAAFGGTHLNSFLGYPVQNVTLQSPSERSSLAGTFAGCLFRERLVEIKIKADASVGDLPKSYQSESGSRYELLVTKLQTTKAIVGGGASVNRIDVKAIYVLVSGPGVVTLDLQAELDKLAAFGLLAPKKAASRLELLCSTARKSTRKGRDLLIFDDLTSNDFEMIPEVANEGCGFCPPQFFKDWLGNHAVGKRTFALQVRIFAPKLGIAKGVLMARPGINKIQLPPSMVKVGPSLSGHGQSGLSDRAVVVVTSNGVYPFPAHQYTARILHGDADPPKSFSPKKFSPMMMSLLESLGVPRPLVQRYGEEFREERGKKLKHASLVGLADPSCKIPSGHVFITGTLGSHGFGREVFVTRYPCTEASDGTMWPLVRERPSGMSSSDWKYLQELHFGGIIFGTPLPGQPPMPNMIADGDLDGDLYFVCWHKDILSHIRTARALPMPETSSVHQLESTSVHSSVNHRWLDAAQDYMRPVGAMIEKHRMIGMFFNLMVEAADASDPEAAHYFSSAYKESIDIGKHGGCVELPRRYWNDIDDRFHRYLCDSS